NGRPIATRDQLVKQVPALARKFPTWSSFANAGIHEIVTGKVLFERKVSTLASMIFLNQGNGKFISKELPNEAQMFPVFAINISDVNSDGNMDILLGQMILKGNGNGAFQSMPARRSGFGGLEAPRDIQSITSVSGLWLYLVATNNDSLYVYRRSALSQ
ncbi:MAG TPA: VCBS repeat-containing protein, partial [Cyclobacteriaceae bacterium]